MVFVFPHGNFPESLMFRDFPVMPVVDPCHEPEVHLFNEVMSFDDAVIVVGPEFSIPLEADHEEFRTHNNSFGNAGLDCPDTGGGA
jgi:hypothetical protein